MDKKKKLTAIFIYVFVIALTACGKTETNYNICDSGSWKDGTYTENAKGKKGNFVVTVIIADGIKDAVAKCLEQASN